MSTEKQREANRANSQKPTGPTTDAGKAQCRLNGLSHGFAAKTVFILDENPDDFWALLADFMADLQPANRVEQALVEKIVQSHWLSLRASSQQSILWKQATNNDGLRDLMLAEPLLCRYQAAADRNFHRCLADLLKLQKQRQKSGIGSAPQIPHETPNAAPEPQPETPAETPQETPVSTSPDPAPGPAPATIFDFPPTIENQIAAIDARTEEWSQKFWDKYNKDHNIA